MMTNIWYQFILLLLIAAHVVTEQRYKFLVFTKWSEEGYYASYSIKYVISNDELNKKLKRLQHKLRCGAIRLSHNVITLSILLGILEVTFLG